MKQSCLLIIQLSIGHHGILILLLQLLQPLLHNMYSKNIYTEIYKQKLYLQLQLYVTVSTQTTEYFLTGIDLLSSIPSLLFIVAKVVVVEGCRVLNVVVRSYHNTTGQLMHVPL